MTDSGVLFQTLMVSFVASIPRSAWGDIRRLVTLAWAVVGLCLSKVVNLSSWGESVESKATHAASRARRFQRWLDNAEIDVPSIYASLVKAALKGWEIGTRVYVALDTSVIKGTPFVLVRVSLIYRGRAIPLAWKVLAHDSATVGYSDYVKVLATALACLPAGLVVTLLADRGFVHAELLHWLHQQHWHYRIRLTGDTLVRLGDRQVVPVAKLCPPKGAAHFYHNIYVLGENIGPVHLALAQLDEPAQDPWYVVSDEPTDLTTLEDFGLRFDIEENFLDDKSNGFQVEDTGLETTGSLERLFLVIAIATLHFTSVGVEVVKRECRHWVDTHWDRGMSYLKIGWSWLRQQKRRNWPVLSAFGLNPAPDPEPALASRRKASRPKPIWKTALIA
jgi:hypothetical protein